MFQNPQWVPKATNSTELTYTKFFLYIHMMKSNSYIRYSKRLTITTNRTIITIYKFKIYVNIVSLSKYIFTDPITKTKLLTGRWQMIHVTDRAARDTSLYSEWHAILNLSIVYFWHFSFNIFRLRLTVSN